MGQLSPTYNTKLDNEEKNFYKEPRRTIEKLTKTINEQKQ